MEKVNVRYLDPETIETPVDFISIDVSFISLKLVFPVAADLLGEDGSLVCLVKPQFEAGREQVGKKGIVRDPKVHCQVIENVITYGRKTALQPWTDLVARDGSQGKHRIPAVYEKTAAAGRDQRRCDKGAGRRFPCGAGIITNSIHFYGREENGVI